MHTMWKGSISFGLVNVPVRMFAATESKDVKFRYLHRACHTPIQYTRTCPRCQQAVEWEDIVRGFEYEPDKYILLDEQDFEAVGKKRSHTIDITDFVQLPEIDPVYFDRTYYLAPETSGAKAYRLLQAAMRQTGKIAVARTVLRNAETLACLRVNGDVLMMETLFWPDEVRATEELPNVRQQTVITAQEIDMATTLINQLAAPFEPGKYVDERRQALMDRIEAKVADQPAAVATPAGRAPENIVDLMQALQESIRLTRNTGPTRRWSS